MTRLLLGLLLLATARADVHLFILSGQSNMARLKPEDTFVPAVEEAFGKKNVVVVKSAEGGQPIRRWFKEWKPAKGPKPEGNGDLYEVLLTKVREAVNGRELDSVTFVWMQGERDAREGHGSVYAASFKGLLGQLSKDLGRDDLNFVIGRLSDFGNDDRRFPDWNTLRKMQVALAGESPRGAWVDTDDLNDKPGANGGPPVNDLHYTKKGYDTLGERFAEAAIGLVRKQPKNQ